MTVVGLVLAGVAVGLVVCEVLAPRLYAFLAVSRPARGNLLVVEGWIFSHVVPQAAEVFRGGSYAAVLISGVAERGLRVPASSAATERRLVRAGVPKEAIVQVPARRVRVHRTAASARAIGSWLEGQDGPHAVDVFTAGAHARKTYVTYRRILGPRVAVGIVAGRVAADDAARWWRSRRVVYAMVKGLVGWLYAIAWPFPPSRDARPTRR